MTIERILIPKNDSNWIILCIQSHPYELRLGGMQKISFSEINYKFYESHDGEVLGKRVANILTNDESLYFLLDDGDLLIHTPSATIDGKGETGFGLLYYHADVANQVLSGMERDGLQAVSI